MKKIIVGMFLLSSTSAFAQTAVIKSCESKIDEEAFESRTTNKIIFIRSGVYCQTDKQQCQQQNQRRQAERQAQQPQSSRQSSVVHEINQIRILGEGEVLRFNGVLYSCEI